ncbi:Uncharacterized protein dnm_089140 [Desulfonema magnum]|uniref:Uncharacterized protein n=1 Tax=Desulfonema magnum TaxID=45655 RepID=A0A975BW28_9BACT|nr:Uncharacterized protein dnm_089140 [Desulfonema magnum]
MGIWLAKIRSFSIGHLLKSLISDGRQNISQYFRKTLIMAG